MPKHILFVSYDGMTDPLGQSQVLPYLAGLSKKGFHFSLLSFEKPDRFEKDENFIRQICSKNNIDWYPQKYTKRPPVLSTLFDLWKMQRVFRKIHRSHPIDLIHCRSYISAFVGLKQKRKRNIPWLFDMRGFWADERIEGNIWNPDHFIYKRIYNFFKRKERLFFNQSTAIISLTHAGKAEILSWKMDHVPDTKITVIPCCVDLDKFNPVSVSLSEKEAKRHELGLVSRKILGYIGSIGTWYLLNEMLSTFKQLSEQDENLIFLFVTKESESAIKSAAGSIGIPGEKIKVVSALHNEVPLLTSLFDYSIFYIKPSFSKIASSPTKQGELMAMGIPIICNSKVGDSAAIIRKYNAGIVVDLENDQVPEIDLNQLKDFSREQSIKGANEFYSLQSGISEYSHVYRQCLSK